MIADVVQAACLSLAIRIDTVLLEQEASRMRQNSKLRPHHEFRRIELHGRYSRVLGASVLRVVFEVPMPTQVSMWKEEDVRAWVNVLVAVVHAVHWCVWRAWPEDYVPARRGSAVIRHEDSCHFFCSRVVVAPHITVRGRREAEMEIFPLVSEVLVRQVFHLAVFGNERRAVFEH